ncbi:Hypothetical predicted protein [Podarcis lilfordi]|uniref:Uncharacterized protein n=1 Tax=Podarcis lilfordi TaxID=74358 RepID=A0AA35K962_9SAUR|nr:Hypothetical predicted protein [Podarcis lilfordi]
MQQVALRARTWAESVSARKLDYLKPSPMPLPAPLFPARLDGRGTVESRSSALEDSGSGGGAAPGALRKRHLFPGEAAEREQPWDALFGADRQPG